MSWTRVLLLWLGANWIQILILLFTAGTFILVLIDVLLDGPRGIRRRWQAFRGYSSTFSVQSEGGTASAYWLPGRYRQFAVRIKAIAPSEVQTSYFVLTVPDSVFGPGFRAPNARAFAGSEELGFVGPNTVGDGTSGTHYYTIPPPADFARSREAVCSFILWGPPELSAFRVVFRVESNPPCKQSFELDLTFPEARAG